MDIAGLPRITPSKPNVWEGTREPADARYTNQQLVKMKAMRGRMMSNQRRFNLPASYEIKLRQQSKWVGQPDEELTIECPVISATKDRSRLCVIAPNGYDEWVAWK